MTSVLIPAGRGRHNFNYLMMAFHCSKPVGWTISQSPHFIMTIKTDSNFHFSFVGVADYTAITLS